MMFLELLIWGSWLPLLALYLGGVLGFSGGRDRLDLRHAGDCLSGRPVFRRPDRGPDALRPRNWPCCTSSAASRCSRSPTRRRSGRSFSSCWSPAGLHADDVADQRGGVPSRADPQRDFGRIRLWGTIGWIAASWPFVFILAGKTGPDLNAALSSIFTVAGLASIALAAFSLTLRTRRRRNRKRHRAPLQPASCCAIRRCSCCSWRR